MNIKMGNDEFILYLRKNALARMSDNVYLGKIIWEKIKTLDPNAFIVERDQKCLWNCEGENVNEHMLPKTATQFSFEKSIIPQIYDFLDSL